MKKILGIDLGIASIGWSLVQENENREQNKIIDCGVRIFTKAENPKTGASLALPRREARGARRVIRRKRKRMKDIKNLFIPYLGLKNEDLFEQKENELIHEENSKAKNNKTKDNQTIYKEKKKLDIWQLRKEALERKLTNKEFARILTQIAKRRGYKSNAKNKDGEEDGEKIGRAIENNKKQMKEKQCSTIGQFFYHQMLQESKKNDNQKIKEKAKIRNTTKDYKHCVTREMLKEEVEKIFEKQEKFDFDFRNKKEEFKNEYLDIAFLQNPLRSVAGMIGNCTLEKEEKRSPKQCYSSEIFVALTKIINNATLVNSQNRKKEIHLLEEYCFEKIEEILQKTKAVKYSTLRKKLNISDEYSFKHLNYAFNVEKTSLPSFEKIVEKEEWLTKEQKEKISWIPEKNNPDEKRQKVKNLKTYVDLRRKLNLSNDFKFPNLKYLEKREDIIKKVEDAEIISLKGYHTIKDKLKENENLFKKIFNDKKLFNKIGEILAIEKDEEKTAEELKKNLENFNAENENSFATEEINFIIDKLKNVSFDKFLNLSIVAIDKLLPHMKQGMKYDKACRKAGYKDHSNFSNGEKKEKLRTLNEQENYQVTNPVVKRAFAQFRKIVNAIIKKYGKFDAMHIEVGRELKNSKKKRDEIKSGQDAFKDHKKSLEAQFEENFGRKPSGKELLKIRLYEEQIGKCIYSGSKINYNDLINNSQYCQVDHILPYSRFFDNSLHNKVLSLSIENQEKGNQTPFEYLANRDENSQKWHEFMQRVNTCVNIKGMKKRNLFNTTLPNRKGNQLTEDDTESTEDSFIARNLIDTQFLAKFIKNFVENNLLFKENDKIKQKVKVRNGALTSYLRHLWGLGKKDRNSHLHHALDATIIAFSTQRQVQLLSTYSAQNDGFKTKKAQEKLKENSKIKMNEIIPFHREEFLERLELLGKYDPETNNKIVSHAPRRKVTGAAHEETLYGGRDNNKKYQTRKRDDKGKIKIKEIKGSTKLYPMKLNKGKTLAKKGGMPRIDIFQHKENKKYFIVPIYVVDFIKKDLPNLAIVSGNQPNGKKKPWLEMNEEYKFIASFYKNDLIKVIFSKEDESSNYFGIYNSTDSSDGRIKIHKIEGGKTDKKKQLFRKKIEDALQIEKYQVSPLGEIQKVKLPEKRIGTKKQLKQIKKQKKLN